MMPSSKGDVTARALCTIKRASLFSTDAFELWVGRLRPFLLNR